MLQFKDLSKATIEKIKSYRYDRIIEKHEGPEHWRSVIEYDHPEFIEAGNKPVLLPIDREHHKNITLLRTITDKEDNTLNKPRKRRLRKKLRVGEFQELGFEIKFQLKPDLEIAFDETLDSWMEFVKSQGWAFGGGADMASKELEGFVTKEGRGSLTEEDRLAAERWLADKEWIDVFHVGPLKDAWHGWQMKDRQPFL